LVIYFYKSHIINPNSDIMNKRQCVKPNSTRCTDISQYKLEMTVLDKLGIPIISRNIKYQYYYNIPIMLHEY